MVLLQCLEQLIGKNVYWKAIIRERSLENQWRGLLSLLTSATTEVSKKCCLSRISSIAEETNIG